jgi:hypothetical protein
MAESVGERFVTAIATRDAEGLSALLAPKVDFRGLTPKRFWEASTPEQVVDVVLGNWFEETDHIESVRRLEVGEDVGDVQRVGYRFDITNGDGPSVVEQQAYYWAEAEKIHYLRIVCSGFRPRTT